ncbi:MAG TPA: Gfo/Idh/MocA family oxidoreductase [Jatrophihabitantaceae bacterium]
MSYGIVLAGASGYGRSYLRELASLEASGTVRLLGVCNPAPLDDDGRALVGDRPVDADLARLLDRTRPDIGIVASPIHTHVPLARQVLDAGASLLLEKPPASTLAGWRGLVTCASGRAAAQVGFQSLGSAAFTHLRSLLRDGELGEVRGIGGWGAWSRPDAYYERSNWAGRRTLDDGTPVVDGALTNPFAHAVATALALDGSTGAEDVAGIELDLLRSRDIEADDTSCLRLRTARGTTIVIAVTLCAASESEPVVVVHGSRGRAELHYTRDVLVLDGEAHTFGRTTPLRNLLAHLDDPRQPLQSDLAGCGAFMRVLEAVRLAPDPAPIEPQWLRRRGTGGDATVSVVQVERSIQDAAEQLRTFNELGVPWAPLRVP